MATVGGGWDHEAPWGMPVGTADGESLWETRTFRRFIYAVLLLGALVALFMLLGAVESLALGSATTLSRPFAMATRCVGVAHFVIGFLFMVSSPAMGSARSRMQIALALVVGAGICGLYFRAGGHDAFPRFPSAFVFVYFLVHEFRDEGFFHRQYQKIAPVYPGGRSSPVPLLLTGAVLGLLALLWSFLFLRGQETRDLIWLFDQRQMDGLSFSLAWLIPAVFLASAGATCLVWAKRRHGASLRRLFSLDRPLWAVYAGIPLVWWVCLWIGGDAHSIVLLHVAAWWVFSSATLARFGKKGGPGELGLFGWMRRTQAGFQTLHVGLALLVLLTAFLWVYRFGMADSSPLAWIVKQEYFYYWTLMHVTVSFVPRPSRG